MFVSAIYLELIRCIIEASCFHLGGLLEFLGHASKRVKAALARMPTGLAVRGFIGTTAQKCVQKWSHWVYRTYVTN